MYMHRKSQWYYVSNLCLKTSSCLDDYYLVLFATLFVNHQHALCSFPFLNTKYMCLLVCHYFLPFAGFRRHQLDPSAICKLKMCAQQCRNLVWARRRNISGGVVLKVPRVLKSLHTWIRDKHRKIMIWTCKPLSSYTGWFDRSSKKRQSPVICLANHHNWNWPFSLPLTKITTHWFLCHFMFISIHIGVFAIAKIHRVLHFKPGFPYSRIAGWHKVILLQMLYR